jgi:GNAT superfamily N-acetyltransferase
VPTLALHSDCVNGIRVVRVVGACWRRLHLAGASPQGAGMIKLVGGACVAHIRCAEFTCSEKMLHVIRRADAQSAEAIARLLRLVLRTSLPFLPQLHAPDEDLWFVRNVMLVQCEVWVAEIDDIDGLIAFRDGWIDYLYVRPERQRRGIGKALLGQAMKTDSPLCLWTFQKNVAAIRFCLAQGFCEIERTDGRRNEEREPDILMEWERA